MKAAIYCRVSTEGQEQDGTSLKTQLEACLKYCKRSASPSVAFSNASSSAPPALVQPDNSGQ